MKAILLVATCVFSILGFSQEEIKEINTKSQFSIALLQGFNRSKVEKLNGNSHYKESINLAHGLQFRYRYCFTPKWNISAGVGFGLQNYKSTPPIYGEYYLGSGFHSFSYDIYSRIDLFASYQIYSWKNKSIHLLFGGGWNRFGTSSSSYGFSTPEASADLNVTQDNHRKAFASLGAAYVIRTKRKDEISFDLNYQYGFKSYMNGSYVINENGVGMSWGSIENYLRGLQLGVNYTFTRIQKKERIQRIQATGVSSKTARKQGRMERRSVDPKSMFVSLGGGIAVARNQIKGKNSPFQNGGFPAIQPRIAFEKGIKNNFFVEADYHYFEFWEVTKEKKAASAMGSNAFYGHFLNVGGGYLIQNKNNNFQFVKLHAGIGIGGNFMSKGGSSYGTSLYTFSDSTFLSVSDSSYLKSRLMPIVYLGVSKDFRITDRFGLSLLFRQQIGFNTSYQTDRIYSTSENPTPKSISSVLNGTGFFFQLGLRYRISPGKKEA